MEMMEFQTQINAPPEKVFGYLSDLEKHSEWSHIEEVKKTSEGPVGVGSTYESRGHGPLGMATNDKLEVTEHQPDENFAWRVAGGMGMEFNWSFEIKAQDGGSLLIERLVPPAGLMADIVGALFAKRETRKVVPEGLAKIKERLEVN